MPLPCIAQRNAGSVKHFDHNLCYETHISHGLYFPPFPGFTWRAAEPNQPQPSAEKGKSILHPKRAHGSKKKLGLKQKNKRKQLHLAEKYTQWSSLCNEC